MRIKLSLFLALFVAVLNVSPVAAYVGHQEAHEVRMDTATNTATSPATRTLRQNITERDVNTIQQVQKDFQSEIVAKREVAKQTAEARREELHGKIAALQDAQKKAVLQRLDSRFMTVNDTTTDKWATALETLNGLLDRVGSEAANLEASGVNTTALDASVLRAQTAITTAKTAVTTQAGKSYVMTVTTEATVGTSAATTVTQLRTDLRNTFQLVQNAKQAVRNAVVALNTVKNVPAEPTPVASESAGIEE